MSESRKGRLDLLFQDGLGQFADVLDRRMGIGLRGIVQPVINRFVSENVSKHQVPVTPEEIAEHMGILRKPPKKVREVQR